MMRWIAVVFLGAIVLGGVTSATTSPNTQTAPPVCAVRFDGLYFEREAPFPDRIIGEGLRFYQDGTVALAGGELDVATRSLALRAKGVPDTGTYRVEGCNLHIEIKDPFDRVAIRIGSIEGNRLKVVFQARQGFNAAFAEEFSFMPAMFAEIEKAYLAERRQVAAAQTAPPQIRIGSATMDAGCTKVRFDAATAPVTLAAGARTLGFELTGNFPSVTLAGGPICRAGGLEMTTCNQHAIVMGRPELIQQTTIVRCRDQQAFAPGKYVVRAGSASVPIVIR